MQKIVTSLMFDGKAEEAMNFYTSLFSHSQITDILRYEANQAGTEGTVMYATFTLNDVEFRCIDSSTKHSFGFTASMSLYVKCDTEKEIDELFASLSESGQVFMPLAQYPFSRKFGWLTDRFEVSWQLDLTEK
jgi:predicted 3-demethylubiquinone-9 3-methyltransferase (glyoxalase superfamily)